MKDVHFETRWKVRRRVHLADLQEVLNKLSAKNWTIYQTQITGFVAVVVAHKKVKVWE